MPIYVKNKIKDQSVVQCVLWGLLAAVFVIFLGSGVVSALVYNERIKETSVVFNANLLVFLSVVCAGVISGKLVKKKIAVISAITTCVTVLVLLCVNVMFFDVDLSGTFSGISAAVLGWIVAALAGGWKKPK